MPASTRHVSESVVEGYWTCKGLADLGRGRLLQAVLLTPYSLGSCRHQDSGNFENKAAALTDAWMGIQVAPLAWAPLADDCCTLPNSGPF